MPLESATYVHDLVSTNPTGPDGLGQADDHLRLIKAVLQATFPTLTAPLTAALADLNNGHTPVGGIILWSGAVAAIPTNWQLCDGTAGTPDLRDKFVVGAGNTYAVGATGGAASVTASTDSQGAHTHTGVTGTYALTIADIPGHNHPVIDPGHLHTQTTALAAGGSASVFAPGNGAATGNVSTASATTGITTSNTGGGTAHSHTISSDGAHTHSVTAATLPPYLALAYIQRIA